MKKIRDATTLIALLEQGDLAVALSDTITETLAKLKARQTGRREAAKGSVTLTLAFKVDGPSVQIDADIAAKLPKEARSTSVYFVLDDGSVSTEHPQQITMELGPRVAVER